MIKTIAFDLWGCLLKENDFVMTEQEEILEKEFWNLNFDQEYYPWASQTLSLSEKEVREVISSLMKKLYSLREDVIFEKILEQYPQMTFAIASNHVSQVKESLQNLWILEKCRIVLISWDSWYEKPSKEFFALLREQIGESADEILFVDDKEENIQGAEKVWLKGLWYHRWTSLSESVLNYLWKVEK